MGINFLLQSLTSKVDSLTENVNDLMLTMIVVMAKVLYYYLYYWQVHRSNKCEFAELVRKSYFGSMSSPDISGSHAVRMLIEMGMDKLCRDYASAFVGEYLQKKQIPLY